MDTLAAQHSGTICYTDVDDLTVGTVSDAARPTAVITTSSGITNDADVGLTTGGNLTINNLVQITGVTSDLTLDVTGSVTQTAAIHARGLQILGTGVVNLDNNANDVDTLAAEHSQTISYTDANALSVGTVTDSACSTAETSSGITNDADVRLTTGGNLSINNLVTISGGHDLTLDVTGSVTQTAAISAHGLQLLGTGAVDLEHAANDVDTLAAQHSGTICYTDVDDLTVGTVSDAARPTAVITTSSGITNDADVGLTTGGNLTINNLVQITGVTSDLTLDVTGSVTQTAAIHARGLQILGTGVVNLDNNANDVDTLAAEHSQTISYTDANALSVGTVTDSACSTAETSSGITNDADVRLTTGGNLSINNLVTISGGNDLTLDVTGMVTQTAAISARACSSWGRGPWTWSTPPTTWTRWRPSIAGRSATRTSTI